LARYNRDVIAEATDEGGVLNAADLMSLIGPQRTRLKKPAPRPGPHSGEFPEDAYADPTMQDEYADWFSASVVPGLESGEIGRGDLGPRERAAYELMNKIDELLQRLDRANPDKGEDITL
jgi:hypothetical protein